MKLNITIDLDDLYTEYDDYENGTSLNDIILSDLKNQVTRELKTLLGDDIKSMKDQVLKIVQEEIIKISDTKIPIIAKEIISETFFNSDYKVKKYGDEFTVKEYVEGIITKKDQLAKESVESYLDSLSKKNLEEMKKTADVHFKSIKDKYDLLFASQIVTKLGEKGMLKEDVAKLLLDN